jgi:flagellar protein FliT
MTSIEILTTYRALSELTDTMLDAARQDEWDHLAILEQRCQRYVGELMQAPPAQMSSDEQRAKIEIIRGILQNDAQIRALTEPRMHELQQRLHSTRNAQRGIHAYGERPA